MSTEKKTCGGCKFALLWDTGYSNYTVEGTDFHCMKRLHPDGVFDNWYGEDKRLTFAETCFGYEGGEPIIMDVEGENETSLTPEQKARFDGYNAAR